MKRLFLLAMLFAVSFTAQSETINETIEILKYVESQHDPVALGDFRGDTPTSFGILQIQQGAIDDVNRIYGTSYTIQDAFNISCSEEIFILYTGYWGGKLKQREGRKVTTADIVRIWNGGPRGYQRSSTEWYLKKYLKYKKKRYLCNYEANPEQSEVHNQWSTGNSNQEVYAYRRCSYLQDS
jgi:hypothetical protein